jgi:hypothetical protein
MSLAHPRYLGRGKRRPSAFAARAPLAWVLTARVPQVTRGAPPAAVATARLPPAGCYAASFRGRERASLVRRVSSCTKRARGAAAEGRTLLALSAHETSHFRLPAAAAGLAASVARALRALRVAMISPGLPMTQRLPHRTTTARPNGLARTTAKPCAASTNPRLRMHHPRAEVIPHRAELL